MKNILLTALAFVALAVTSVKAQEKGDISAGLTLQAGTKIPTVAIGLSGHYVATDHFRLGLNLDYFIKNRISSFDVSADLHYLFPLSDKFTIYPLAGIGISHYWNGQLGVTPFIVNVGAGAQYNISSRLYLTLEMKGRLGNNACQFVVGPGLYYKF